MSKQRMRGGRKGNGTPLNDETQDLLLDDIYNSPDPAIKEYLSTVFYEEAELANERALLRVATKFRHMLSPQIQKVLDMRQLPSSQVAMG